ncbi:MAG: hypothetical protein IPK03_14520 [Bacteroidetes bacterium]|nr:hypothetical protein [Bacteroidota bacterium]
MLVSNIALIVRFWISESAISLKHLSEDRQVYHYIFMIGRILAPYLKPKGKREFDDFFENWEPI